MEGMLPWSSVALAVLAVCVGHRDSSAVARAGCGGMLQGVLALNGRQPTGLCYHVEGCACVVVM